MDSIVIYRGYLQTNEEIFEVKQINLNQVQEIMKLQDIVFKKLEDQDSLEKLSKEEYVHILKGNGFLIGAFLEDELIAVRALLIPEMNDEHLGMKIGLKEEEQTKVIYQEITFVHPSYRGNRLQQQLATLIMEELTKSTSEFRYVCSTVAPLNIPSLLDKFKQGMQVKVLDRMYGEKLRYVFIKDLEEEEQPSWIKSRKVSIREIKLQQRLLASGWVGYELVKEGQEFFIRFGK